MLRFSHCHCYLQNCRYLPRIEEELQQSVMNIHQLCFLVALIILFSYSRYVDCELDWVEFCINNGISGNGNNNNGNGNGNSGNGNENNGNGNGDIGNGNGNNGNGNGNNGNGNGNDGKGNGNGNSGNGNSNNGNNNNRNNTINQEATVDLYIQTICDARIASLVTNCTDTFPAFTLNNALPNTGEMVLDMTPVTNLDCSHLCAFLSECAFFTYEPSGSSCQIYIVGSDTPSEPVVWRKNVL